MSALPTEADMLIVGINGCFVPKPEIGFVAFHDVWVRRLGLATRQAKRITPLAPLRGRLC
jgi:hypothetical protein